MLIFILFHLCQQEAFKAFHTDMPLVSKYMKPIHIGKIGKTDRPSEDELKTDFIELKKTAEQMVNIHRFSNEAIFNNN